MGMDCHTYIGVYIKVPVFVGVVDVPEHGVCNANKEHITKPEFKFCPLCGGEITVTTRKKSVTKQFLPWDFDTEDFFVPESHINSSKYSWWLIDRYNSTCSYELSDNDTTHLTPDMISSALESFHEQYSALLGRLREVVGDGVIAEFGVIQYWS